MTLIHRHLIAIENLRYLDPVSNSRAHEVKQSTGNSMVLVENPSQDAPQDARRCPVVNALPDDVARRGADNGSIHGPLLGFCRADRGMTV